MASKALFLPTKLEQTSVRAIVFWAVACYLLLIWQQALLGFFTVHWPLLNLVLLAVVLIAFFEPPASNNSFFIAAVSGLLLDTVLALALGASILGLLAAVWLAKKLANIFSARNVISAVLTLLPSCALYYLISWLFTYLLALLGHVPV